MSDRMGANESFWLHIQFVYYIVFAQVMQTNNERTTTSDKCRFFEWIIRIGYIADEYGVLCWYSKLHTHKHTSNRTEKEREQT